ncbi:MAG: hypothetical protein NZM37_05230 [Sandaracinaceae bacterium]|nr:hypothetical protein [Sandaracinaceae bacterium]
MRQWLWVLFLCLACGGGKPKGQEVGALGVQAKEKEAQEDPRLLLMDMPYRELVRRIEGLDAKGLGSSEAACLFRRNPLRLEADLAPALRGLPDPPSGLKERFEQGFGVRAALLTRYGLVGDPQAELVFVALTTVAPGAKEVLLVWVEGEGIWLGSSRSERFERRTLAQLSALPSEHPVFLAASGETPVFSLLSVLERLPPLPGKIGLATLLPQGVRLPPPFEEARPELPLCRTDEMAEGDFPGDFEDQGLLRQALRPLLEGARDCLGNTPGPGAQGGRLGLFLRISPRGEVEAACVYEDEQDDPFLRACIVRQAKRLLFPPPKGGAALLQIPLRLEPGIPHRQRAFCP